MENSILTDVKVAIGVPEKETHFDNDILMHINTTIFKLHQVGIGPKAGLTVKDDSQTWEDLIGEEYLQPVKSYVVMGTRVLFDPPTGAAIVMESINKSMDEILWRLMVEKEIIDE